MWLSTYKIEHGNSYRDNIATLKRTIAHRRHKRAVECTFRIPSRMTYSEYAAISTPNIRIVNLSLGSSCKLNCPSLGEGDKLTICAKW